MALVRYCLKLSSTKQQAVDCHSDSVGDITVPLIRRRTACAADGEYIRMPRRRLHDKRGHISPMTRGGKWIANLMMSFISHKRDHADHGVTVQKPQRLFFSNAVRTSYAQNAYLDCGHCGVLLDISKPRTSLFRWHMSLQVPE